jgi:hypothetical protein
MKSKFFLRFGLLMLHISLAQLTAAELPATNAPAKPALSCAVCKDSNKCATCRGTGEQRCDPCKGEGKKKENCTRCGGDGRVSKTTRHSGRSVRRTSSCSTCGGRGHRQISCTKCGSDGKEACVKCRGKKHCPACFKSESHE